MQLTGVRFICYYCYAHIVLSCIDLFHYGCSLIKRHRMEICKCNSTPHNGNLSSRSHSIIISTIILPLICLKALEKRNFYAATFIKLEFIINLTLCCCCDQTTLPFTVACGCLLKSF